jgi:hypothetical protein
MLTDPNYTPFLKNRTLKNCINLSPLEIYHRYIRQLFNLKRQAIRQGNHKVARALGNLISQVATRGLRVN